MWTPGSSPQVTVTGTVIVGDVEIRDSNGNPLNSTMGALDVYVTNQVSVTGPLTDAELRAAPVPVTGPLIASRS
jgi:hypothetical protein